MSSYYKGNETVFAEFILSIIPKQKKTERDQKKHEPKSSIKMGIQHYNNSVFSTFNFSLLRSCFGSRNTWKIYLTFFHLNHKPVINPTKKQKYKSCDCFICVTVKSRAESKIKCICKYDKATAIFWNFII